MGDFILPRFDELYVVSDIHMGGPPNFQILKHGSRLGTLFQHLSTVRTGERVGLVLNASSLTPLPGHRGFRRHGGSPRMRLKRIYRDPAFAPIWDGLTAFVREPGRRLGLCWGISTSRWHCERRLRSNAPCGG